MGLPLEDVRILEFGFMIAGPLGPRLLADYGAQVIKVESIRRPDTFRRSGAFGDGAGGLNSSRSYMEFNRNKLNITVDLTTPQGRQVIRELVKISDAVLDNYTADVMARWELDYQHLRGINPGIIMVDMPGMGLSGPQRHWATNGMPLMSWTGMTHLWTLPESAEPVGSQTAHPDYIAAAHAAFVILAALHARARTGKGQHVDLAQAESSAAMLGPFYLDYLINGRDPEPRGNRSPSAAPFGAYRCQPAEGGSASGGGEDRWCAIAVRSDEEWRRFCHALGEPPWTRERRFATVLGRLRHREELDALVEGWTQERTPHQVMATLQAAGVSAGVVMDGRDLSQDPHLRHRGYLVEIPHPEMRTLTYPGLPVHLSQTPARIRRHAPLFGEHNQYVFGELLGMSQERIAQLTEAGVLT